jgi:hypothetical protein
MYLAFLISFVLYDYFTDTVDPQFFAFPAYVYYLVLMCFCMYFSRKTRTCYLSVPDTEHCYGYEQ